MAGTYRLRVDLYRTRAPSKAKTPKNLLELLNSLMIKLMQAREGRPRIRSRQARADGRTREASLLPEDIPALDVLRVQKTTDKLLMSQVSELLRDGQHVDHCRLVAPCCFDCAALGWIEQW